MNKKRKKRKPKEKSHKKKRFDIFRKGKDDRIKSLSDIRPGKIDPALVRENEQKIEEFFKRKRY